MRFKKATYLLIIMMLACTAGMAQVFAVRSFSPIASSNGTLTSSSSPFVMYGQGKCVTSATGLSVLSIANNGTGSFGASCKEIPPVANVLKVSVSLKVYPNPTNGLTTLKCEGEFDANLFCQVRIMSIEGKMMMSQMVSMKDVQAGYMINATAYAAGTYVVVMDFMDQRYNMKFIKI